MHEFEAWNRPWLRELGIKTILDIGAYTGQFFLLMKKVFPEADVYCFEPLRESFEVVDQKVSRFQGSRAFNTAVGENQGTVSFYRNDFSAASSVLPLSEEHRQLISEAGSYPEALNETQTTVSIDRLDEICKTADIKIKSNLLIKIDVQGFEDKVVLGGQETFAQAKVVVSEVSFFEAYAGQVLFDGMYSLMRNMGFVFKGFIAEQHSTLDDVLLQADAIFVRE